MGTYHYRSRSHHPRRRRTHRRFEAGDGNAANETPVKQRLDLEKLEARDLTRTTRSSDDREPLGGHRPDGSGVGP